MRGEPIPLWRATCYIGNGDEGLSVWMVADCKWLERTGVRGVYAWGDWVLAPRSLPVAYVWVQGVGRCQLKVHSVIRGRDAEQLRRNAEDVLEAEGAADTDAFIAEHVAPLWPSDSSETADPTKHSQAAALRSVKNVGSDTRA